MSVLVLDHINNENQSSLQKEVTRREAGRFFKFHYVKRRMSPARVHVILSWMSDAWQVSFTTIIVTTFFYAVAHNKEANYQDPDPIMETI